jgi:glucose-6-phosphate 1-dehydrogenase
MIQDRPFDMIVIGGTGDLARRKLLPALYFLHKDEAIEASGRIFAVARHKLDREGYLADIFEDVRQQIPTKEFSEDVWKSFAERIHYFAFSAIEPENYSELREVLESTEGTTQRSRVFYLATSPSIYGKTSRAIHAAGLANEGSRIVLEKPIGHDLESAMKINAQVGEFFADHQIYRIDHYLGKETVQNLMVLRFGNALYEPMWRREHIDHVQITVAETLGVEERGAYYDRAGALRDMVQNHILQLLCLVAMEPPARLDQDAIREEKIKVLRSLRPIRGSQVKHKTVRGRYRAGAIDGQAVPGYLEEKGIPEESTTETFVALLAEIDNWRWAGVPFYLRTGKRLSARVSEIVIQFKQVPHMLFEDQGEMMEPNRLVIRLQPDESIKLGMMVKEPGTKVKLKRVHLNLNLGETFTGHTPLAYERLLLDVIRGNATLFIHRQEVEEAWRWIEPILDGWEERGRLPRQYGAGTWGPPESVALVVREERSWYEHLVGQ